MCLQNEFCLQVKITPKSKIKAGEPNGYFYFMSIGWHITCFSDL